MVFATAQQLLGSSIFSLDPQDKLLGQERVSPTVYYDRIVCLIQKRPSVKKCRNGSSSSSAPPLSSSSPPSLTSSSSPSSSSPSTCGSSTPLMALKEHLAALAFDTCSHKGYVVLEREPEGALSMESWSEIEELLTELQRSLLETQWALTSEPEHRVLEVEEASSIVRSGRPSARQRRFGNRKQNMVSAVKDGGSSCAAPTHESNERKGKHLWISEALATVTTLGLRGKRELLTKEEEVILSKKMKVGQNLKAARRKLTNVLGYEPSDEVWASSVNLSFSQVQSKILEADRARDQMFVCNLRLVFSVANKYSSLGVSLPDLIQEGAQGLLRGLEKFNHKKGFKLSTYVHWWIRQGITRALADHSRTVRLPAHMHERLGVINRAAATLRMEGVTVSVKSLSQAVNLPDEMVTVALKATKKMISLDKTKRWGHFNPEEESLHNYVADLRPESDPWIAVDKMSMRDDVDGLLAKILNKREREIVRLHYGLDRADGRGVSLEKISHRYGISRERTRQVEGCALRKLAAMGQRMDLDLPLSIN